MRDVWIRGLVVFIALPVPAMALNFNLYGDMTLHKSDETTEFSIGTLDLNTQEHISDTTVVTAQLLLENASHGVELEIERFTITKRLSDTFSITAGRFHKALGLWNHNFHHGSLVQDAIEKPFFLELEESHEGIFPAHLVGIDFEGETTDWSYQFAIGNSTGMSTEPDAEDAYRTHTLNTADPSTDKTLAFRGTYRLADNLELGMLLMSNQVVETGHEFPEDGGALSERGTTLFDQIVAGIDFSYRAESYYAFGEFYQISYDDNQDITEANLFPVNANPDTYNAQAFYVQLGMDLADDLTLYTRYESLAYDDNATFFTIQGIPEGSQSIIGLSYRIEESHTLRFEVRQEDFDGSDSEMHYTVQWYFLLL